MGYSRSTQQNLFQNFIVCIKSVQDMPFESELDIFAFFVELGALFCLKVLRCRAGSNRPPTVDETESI